MTGGGEVRKQRRKGQASTYQAGDFLGGILGPENDLDATGLLPTGDQSLIELYQQGLGPMLELISNEIQNRPRKLTDEWLNLAHAKARAANAATAQQSYGANAARYGTNDQGIRDGAFGEANRRVGLQQGAADAGSLRDLLLAQQMETGVRDDLLQPLTSILSLRGRPLEQLASVYSGFGLGQTQLAGQLAASNPANAALGALGQGVGGLAGNSGLFPS